MTRTTKSFAGKITLLALFAMLCGALCAVPQAAWADEAPASTPAQTIQDSEDAKHVDATNLTSWERLQGNIALDTMKSIVKKGWTSCKYAIVATSGGYWDALSASALAGEYDAPVLLTPKDYLSQKTADELERLKVQTVFVVGGPAAVSTHTEWQIQQYGIKTKRVYGDNGAATAVAVAKEVENMGSKTIVVATAGGYWDALSASPYAYATHSPVFLTNFAGTELSGDAIKQIKKCGATKALIAGGEAAVAPAVAAQLESAGLEVVRLAGPNAYGTAAAFAQHCLSEGMGVNHVGVATGTGYWDALCGAALCGLNETVLLLADTKQTKDAFDFLAEHRTLVKKAYVFGGPKAVSAEAEAILHMATRSDSDAQKTRVDRALQFSQAFFSQLELIDPADDSTAHKKNMDSWMAECRTNVNPSSAMYAKLGQESTYRRDAALLVTKTYVTKITDTTISLHVDAAGTQDLPRPKGWSGTTTNHINVTLTFDSSNLITKMSSTMTSLQGNLSL